MMRHAIPDGCSVAAGTVQHLDGAVVGWAALQVDDVATGDESRGTVEDVVNLADLVVLGDGLSAGLLAPVDNSDIHIALPDVDGSHLLIAHRASGFWDALQVRLNFFGGNVGGIILRRKRDSKTREY